jgi:glutaredoxin
MSSVQHVKGNNKGKIILYALSTCVWCKKTKKLLDDLGVEYSYFYVDLLEGEEKEMINREIHKWNPRMSFPTLVINDKESIVGFKETEIREALHL